jgi:zinc transporter
LPAGLLLAGRVHLGRWEVTLTDAEANGLIFACLLDGKGQARPVGWTGIRDWRKEDGPLWIHLDRADPAALQWLRADSGLTPVTIEAITAVETRPRVFQGKRGYVGIFRGVNQNKDNEPEDMVSIRLWCDGHRLISLRHRRLLAPRQIFEELTQTGNGPRTAPELFETMISRLIRQTSSVVSDYELRLDGIELNAQRTGDTEVLRELGELRKDAVEVRRFMAPQREALNMLLSDMPAWMPDELRPACRENADRQQRIVEELDALRERALVIKDDVTNRLAETMNRNMYIISIIAAIFLPLSFVTGLLGINVGGMPGLNDNNAFWIACGLLLVLLIGQILLFRKMKWI